MNRDSARKVTRAVGILRANMVAAFLELDPSGKSLA
jgi:hypothetical protein